MKYPININSFETIIKDDYVYVDKTDLIYDLAQEHVCFLSRPRRFGKSLLISTLEAYFLGRKELFTGLYMENLEQKWDVYPVFHMDFAKGNYKKPEALTNRLNTYITNWEKIYGKNDACIELEDRFQHVIEQAYRQTGKKAVVLIDAYDRPLLDVLGENLEKTNGNILRGFLGTFKSADYFLRFVLLTGVTKLSQITASPSFNQAYDISMDSRYDAICGITENELLKYFPEAIHMLAEKHGCSDDEMKVILKNQYGGYHFSEEMLEIYNPFSLINAFDQNKISDFWYQSGTPTYLAMLLEGHDINMQKLLGRSYTSGYLMDYHAYTKDPLDPLAMLYQSGYLTIKDYDDSDWVYIYTLDFPNNEVRKGFIALIANGYLKSNMDSIDNWALSLNRLLRKGDLNGVRDAFTSFLASIPYEANKDERALDFKFHYQYIFYLINRMLSSHTTLIEKQNSMGWADVVIESDNDIYIFEFKLDGTAEEALAQIDDRQYALPYLSDDRKLHKIGVNISSKTRTVDGWIAI